jgi:phage terminase Nu1 subunit (DNA packaging protein)
MILNERSTSSAEVICLLWSDRQIAAAIGMSLKRVQELARMGLPPGFKVGRNWRFDPDAVRSWVKRNGVSKET